MQDRILFYFHLSPQTRIINFTYLMMKELSVTENKTWNRSLKIFRNKFSDINKKILPKMDCPQKVRHFLGAFFYV
jgi:hypothetical protein